MRRHNAGQTYQLAAGSLAEIVMVEILQLVLAHVESSLAGVVERYKLAITASELELANDEGGGTSFCHDMFWQCNSKRACYYHCHVAALEYLIDPPHGRGDCSQSD